MRLERLIEVSRQVAATASRLAKVATLAELLRQAGPEEIGLVIAWLSGGLRQAKLGVGWASIAAARGAPAASPSLRIAEVEATLTRIAATTGKGSAAARSALLRELFGRATAEEQDFLVRLLTGELRQGALEGIMVEAVAKAAELPAADVRRAAMLAGDLGEVARTALEEGAEGLARHAIQLFRPVRPMLAGTADGVREAIERHGCVAFETKFDGARIQVHQRGDEVRVFSRLMNEVTAAVPEVVAAARALGFRDAVLDGEAISLDDAGRPRPFQSTMRRFGRKLAVAELSGDLPLTPFFFDILEADGAPLLAEPYERRYERLATHVDARVRPPRLVTADAAEAQAFFDAAIAAGHEGLVAKKLDAPYEAGARGAAWLKIKQADTLDLVVLAAEWGHGRRKGWLSNLHLGAVDPAGGFVMLGKTFKGMTDALLAWQTERLLALETSRDGIVVHVRPELVVEIAFNGLQQSPLYPAGLALRFARVVRYRDDKTAVDADTIHTVKRIAFGSA
ncbi:MAG TPA: ATP-dependent DNA ligase [Candidatus Polarisedimenticolia bacterium]|nr:ATP-dependent DNA ligase [Candidatus Polarisedimenticolia bacterium]